MGKLDDPMIIVSICEQFGWTYQEYLEQPDWLIELQKRRMMIDNKEREKSLRKINRGG